MREGAKQQREFTSGRDVAARVQELVGPWGEGTFSPGGTRAVEVATHGVGRIRRTVVTVREPAVRFTEGQADAALVVDVHPTRQLRVVQVGRRARASETMGPTMRNSRGEIEFLQKGHAGEADVSDYGLLNVITTTDRVDSSREEALRERGTAIAEDYKLLTYDLIGRNTMVAGGKVQSVYYPHKGYVVQLNYQLDGQQNVDLTLPQGDEKIPATHIQYKLGSGRRILKRVYREGEKHGHYEPASYRQAEWLIGLLTEIHNDRFPQ